jgi:hypothetical protein
MLEHPQISEPTDFPRKLAARLRLVRPLVEPRQIEVARRLDLPPRVWNRYELGERPVPVEVLAGFCNEFRVCPIYLLFGEIAPTMRGDLAASLQETILRAEIARRGSLPRAVAPKSQRTNCAEAVRT